MNCIYLSLKISSLPLPLRLWTLKTYLVLSRREGFDRITSLILADYAVTRVGRRSGELKTFLKICCQHYRDRYQS